MDSHLSSSRPWSFLSIVFLISLLGGLVSHHLVAFITPQHHAARLIQTNKHLQARNDVLERGLGDLLSNFGQTVQSGLSSLLPNASSILGDLTSGLNTSDIVDSLAEPARFLGVGLGNGALTGFNMSTGPNTTAPSGVDGIAQNLGSGLTSSIFSSDSVKSLLVINSSSLGSSGIIGQAALALAQGLGGGAASGLNFTSTASNAVVNKAPMYNTSGINGVAGNFGQGLSSSFLGGVSLSSLVSMGSSAFGNAGSSSLNIAAIGNGFGSGIGQGAAIGLGFQKDVSTNSMTQDVPGIAQGFAQGLVSSFLQNGTLTEVTKSLREGNFSGFSLSNIDVAKVAEGFAVGMVSGVGSQISTLQVVGADTTSFNDSVSGASTGFGQGLGSSGAKLVQDMLAASSSKATTKKRSLSESSKAVSLRRTDTTNINATDLASVIATLNASSINPLLQTGVNALTCEGIGGFVGIFLGLVQSNTIDLKALTSKASSISTGNNTLNLPDQVFVIKSGGNTFSLNPSKAITTIQINGLSIIPFIVLAAAHIIFAIVAYFVALPLLLILVNTQKLTTLIGGRQPATPTSRWQTYLAYSTLLISVLAFVLGIALRAGGKHFSSAHEILGLIVFLQTLIAAATTVLIKRHTVKVPPSKNLKLVHYGNIGFMLFLSLLTLLFGFSDLSAVSLCVTQAIIPTSGWIVLGWLLLSPFALAIGLQGLVFWLGWMREKNAVRIQKEDIILKIGGKIQEKSNDLV